MKTNIGVDDKKTVEVLTYEAIRRHLQENLDVCTARTNTSFPTLRKIAEQAAAIYEKEIKRIDSILRRLK